MVYQREVRLGLVLYGGVSLAIYENGIAQELFRAIRGDGIYGLIKELTDSDIIVDIISGTSAGGVNGIMLAYALANGRDFTASADLWRNSGDIQSLMRTKDDDIATSILNSTYYQSELANCFANALTIDKSAPVVEELDLFVTGTDANGAISTLYDDQGHPIDVKNHRALFKLCYRKGPRDAPRKNDFDPADAAVLAKLSRITSCFPVAFEPVRVEKDEKQLFRWGKLRDPAVFLDGGILNNKPFTSTIDAVGRRTANRDVERFLIYVEPSPESFTQSPPTPHSPSAVEAGVDALLSIPQYQSIAGDLDAIQSHNERAQRLAEIIGSLAPAPDVHPSVLDATPVTDLTQRGLHDPYYTARLIQLRDTAVGGILNDKDGRGYLGDPKDRQSGRILIESFNAWPGPGTITLTQYDVFFRMRRATHLSHVLMYRVKSGKTVLPAIWDIVNHYYKLYEIVEWAMVAWLNKWQYNWRALAEQYPQLETQLPADRNITLVSISTKVWGEADIYLKQFIYSPIPIPSDTSPQARSDFYDHVAACMKHGCPAANPPVNFLESIDRSFREALKQVSDPPVAELLRNEFCRFPEIDRQIFPVQMGSGFESVDSVRVVRFSPLDAQRGLSRGDISKKVGGRTFNAFGGFFKKSWRANDIMVGRLDAACQLIECLLTKDRLARLGPSAPRTATDLAKYLPKSVITPKLVDSLNAYLTAPQHATTAQWSELIDEIVGAYHQEIYAHEWPTVARCALEQEYAWGRYRTNLKPAPNAFDRANLVWNSAKTRPDPVLVALAANAIASGQIPPFQPGVAVGDGFPAEIPEAVLQELGLLATLRLGKSLLASIPDQHKREKLELSGFYKWPFGRIVPGLYSWVSLRRQRPDALIHTVIPVVCATLVLATLIFGIAIWYLKIHVTDRQMGLLATPGGLSLVIFAIWWFFFPRK